MVDLRTSRMFAAVLLACLTAVPALAQITTGLVSGSVKDGQGAVVPGAMVSLVSAARGSTTETVTNARRELRLSERDRRHVYRPRHAWMASRPSSGPGIVVSPGDRVLVQTLTLEVGSLNETVNVAAETPVIQASTGERSFTIATESVTNLPLARPQLRHARLAGPGRQRHEPHRRWRRDQLHDGRRRNDGHRQQPAPRGRQRGVNC